MTPHQQLLQMLTGYWVSQALITAAKLGLADEIARTPATAAELAPTVGANADALYRLLRMLASVGIFTEQPDGRFTLTPLAEPLRTDQPESVHAFVLLLGDEHYQSWGLLDQAVRTGDCAFEMLYGQPVFEYLAKHPDKAKNFDAAMTGVHGRETAAMLDAYDFSGVKVLADIGGGNGTVIIEALRRNPHLKGMLFDLPHVVERSREAIASARLTDRCSVHGGSFFEAVPSGADAYLMRHIIHDWDDDEALTILKAIRRAIPSDGRLLVIEFVIPPGNEPNFGKLLDLNMFVVPGGRERTEAEYRRLYQQAGFDLTRIVTTARDVSVIEGRPVT